MLWLYFDYNFIFHFYKTPAALSFHNWKYTKCVIIIESCCGGQELYDPAIQICCEFNGLHSVGLKDNKSCCFDKNYDINTQHCLGNTVLAQNQELCGNISFNIDLKVCCRETLHEYPPYPYLWGCCGEELFDRNKNQCCKAHERVVPLDQECCGKGML